MNAVEILERLRDAEIAGNVFNVGGPSMGPEITAAITEVENLQADVAKYKPKPLLFSGLESMGFNVIVHPDMPENQIRFASKEQIEKALEYSRKQIEKHILESQE